MNIMIIVKKNPATERKVSIMCGIIGFSGNTPAVPVLLSGLERLEYRGYDSAGIAVYTEKEIQVRKAKGRLANLKELLQKNPAEGTCGIGHTRWATHGEPSDINAHPHTCQQGNIAIVHNGIIENYLSLKEKLIKKGVQFVSDTDTEVAVQLLSYYYTGDIMSAIYKTMGQLKGSFALGILCTDYPNKIFCARKDSPLVVGALNGCSYIASDIPAILEYTRNVYLLEDMEVAVLSGGSVAFFDGLGNQITKEAMHVDWDVKSAEKGGYQHFMMKEMHEQPTALKDTLSPYIEEKNGKNILTNMPLPEEYVQKLKHISIVACGTAYHAGFLAKYLFERDCRIRTEAEVASEFRYKDPLIEKDDLVIVISQSGETADTITAVKRAEERGAHILVLTNREDSSIVRHAGSLLPLKAGIEVSVAATKSYTAQLTCLYLLGLALASARGSLLPAELGKLRDELRQLPAKMEKALSEDGKVKAAAERLKDYRQMIYIARGVNLPTAQEGALKLKEISYVNANGYPAGELKHGPIALLDENMPVTAVLAPGGRVYDKMISNCEEARARHAFLTGVSFDGDRRAEELFDLLLTVPSTAEIFSPLLLNLPLQLLAYYIADLLGREVDQPRNLAKSVTVE